MATQYPNRRQTYSEQSALGSELPIPAGKDAMARYEAEQALATGLAETFDRYSRQVVIDQAGAQHLSLYKDSPHGGTVTFELVRNMNVSGVQMTTMACNRHGVFETAVVLTVGPHGRARLTPAMRDKADGSIWPLQDVTSLRYDDWRMRAESQQWRADLDESTPRPPGGVAKILRRLLSWLHNIDKNTH